MRHRNKETTLSLNNRGGVGEFFLFIILIKEKLWVKMRIQVERFLAAAQCISLRA
jgi:hypothetical protein